MAMERCEQIITYWLIPAEPARSHFASLINNLAAGFDAPIFEPHLTLYVTKAENEDPSELLNRLLGENEAYRLSIGGIDCSDEFTKTLFVQFEPDESLIDLSVNFRRASVCQNEYQLNPHLSLIYKTMARETQNEIARSISLPFTEVRFDSAKAVISPAAITAREHVEAWRVVAARSFKE